MTLDHLITLLNQSWVLMERCVERVDWHGYRAYHNAHTALLQRIRDAALHHPSQAE